MEKTPSQHQSDIKPLPATAPASAPASEPRSNDWRMGLPELAGSLVTLRELRAGDALPLFAALTNEEVTRFISPPPTTVEGFARLIERSRRQRAAGESVCFAIVARGSDVAIGLFQVRSIEPDFLNAEWGFALAAEFWGTGMFVDGARLAIEFSFDVIGCYRLEARAATRNSRGNAALKKLGARREGTLRKSFLRHGEFLDQALWTLLADEWRDGQVDCGSQVIH
jgi:RimJ/RimL family protein N-acetyltransferase